MLFTDKPVAQEIRSGGAGNGYTVDTAVMDVGSFGHDVLHRERRVFRWRRRDRGAHTSSGSYGTRGLFARGRVERRHRGQSEKGLQMDTQL